MHPKKRQIKHVDVASPRVLGIGGVGVQTVPMYANYGSTGSMGFTQQTTNGEENGEAPETALQEAAEGAAPTSGDGAAAGTSAGAGSAGGM